MIFLITIRSTPRSTLFPYTTLFRSIVTGQQSFELAIRTTADRHQAGGACGQALRCAHFRNLLAKRRRSEEHTSELQSLTKLVCRLLLEKKKYATLTVENDINLNSLA